MRQWAQETKLARELCTAKPYPQQRSPPADMQAHRTRQVHVVDPPTNTTADHMTPVSGPREPPDVAKTAHMGSMHAP